MRLLLRYSVQDCLELSLRLTNGCLLYYGFGMSNTHTDVDDPCSSIPFLITPCRKGPRMVSTYIVLYLKYIGISLTLQYIIYDMYNIAIESPGFASFL